MSQIKKTNKVNNFFTSNSRKLVKDGLKNFKGSISDGERNFIKDITPSTDTLKSIGKGVMSGAEVLLMNKLLLK